MDVRSSGLALRGLVGAATVAGVMAIGGIGASGAMALGHCEGAAIGGAGTETQNFLQVRIWLPSFEGEICPGLRPDGQGAVTYTVNGGAAFHSWNADGTLGEIEPSRDFIGTDSAPNSWEVENITSVAGGANLETIPVAQTAVAIIAHPPENCSLEEAYGEPVIGNADLERTFRGAISTWSELGATGPGCSTPITRVVRPEASGITRILMHYLSQINPKELPCSIGSWEQPNTWTGHQVAVGLDMASTPNSFGQGREYWPRSLNCGGGGQKVTELITASTGGEGSLVQYVNETPGTIGYATVSSAIGHSKIAILSVQSNGTSESHESYSSPIMWETWANCLGSVYSKPIDPSTHEKVGSWEEAGGPNLDWSNVWATDPDSGGSTYPICGQLYDLALDDYDAAGFGAEPGSIARTVADYLGFVTAQEVEPGVLGGQRYLAEPWPEYFPTYYLPLDEGSEIAAQAAIGRIH